MPAKNIFLLIFILSGWTLCTSVTAGDEADTPDLAFLEFLGSFKTQDGKWIDPMEIEKMLDQTDQQIANEEEKAEVKGNE